MTQEIERSEWKSFADGLSNKFLDWETTVRVLSEYAGAQVLSEGLPFNGLTLNERGDECAVELSIGSRSDHQTHNIDCPVSIAFEASGVGPAGTLDIEDAAGTKTLITFVQPMPVLAAYESGKMMSAI